MAATSISCNGQIGEIAGVVWHVLDEGGPMTLAKLAKEIDSPRDVVMQAVASSSGLIEARVDGRVRQVEPMTADR